MIVTMVLAGGGEKAVPQASDPIIGDECTW